MISQGPSVVEHVQRQVSVTPDKRLYAFLDIKGDITQSVTYAQFFQRTTDIALHLQQVAPSSPGERVLLAYPPGIEMIAAMFACFRLGLIPVPVYPPTGHGFASAMHRMDFIARDCGAQMVLTDRSIYWSVKWNQAKSRIIQFSAKKSGRKCSTRSKARRNREFSDGRGLGPKHVAWFGEHSGPRWGSSDTA